MEMGAKIRMAVKHDNDCNSGWFFICDTCNVIRTVQGILFYESRWIITRCFFRMFIHKHRTPYKANWIIFVMVGLLLHLYLEILLVK